MTGMSPVQRVRQLQGESANRGNLISWEPRTRTPEGGPHHEMRLPTSRTRTRRGLPNRSPAGPRPPAHRGYRETRRRRCLRRGPGQGVCHTARAPLPGRRSSPAGRIDGQKHRLVGRFDHDSHCLRHPTTRRPTVKVPTLAGCTPLSDMCRRQTSRNSSMRLVGQAAFTTSQRRQGGRHPAPAAPAGPPAGIGRVPRAGLPYRRRFPLFPRRGRPVRPAA